MFTIYIQEYNSQEFKLGIFTTLLIYHFVLCYSQNGLSFQLLKIKIIELSCNYKLNYIQIENVRNNTLFGMCNSVNILFYCIH